MWSQFEQLFQHKLHFLKGEATDVAALAAAQQASYDAFAEMQPAVSEAAAEAAAQKLVEEYGLVVDPAAVVREIGVGLQQRVEILKTLYRGADILILDEPTAVLTPQETDELFAVIRRVVRELGMTVIIITHKLYEVMAISDRVGVMRKGRLIGVENTCDVDEKKLASMMVGRPVRYDRLEKTGGAGAEQSRVSGLIV